MKAEKEPKNPITALKFGTSIETPTAATVAKVRSATMPAFLNVAFRCRVMLVVEPACS